MKKVYETPTVEKITFNYRDQVVAASGAVTVQGSTDNPTRGEQFIGQIAEGLNIDGCAGFECSSLANWG